MKVCQCCGQMLPPPNLPASLSTLRLTRTQREILEIVCKAGPNGIDTDALYARLYGQRLNGGPQVKTIHVFVCKINHQLRTIGKYLRAEGWSGRGGGPGTYFLRDVKVRAA